MFAPFGEILTLLRPPPKDRNGDPTAPPTSTVLANCPVWPRDSNGSVGNETTFAQDTVIVGYTVLLPPGTDVLATDQVSWRAQVYEIEGEPGIYRSPLTGTTPGITVAIRRVTG